jgi:hypothetical protein
VRFRTHSAKTDRYFVANALGGSMMVDRRKRSPKQVARIPRVGGIWTNVDRIRVVRGAIDCGKPADATHKTARVDKPQIGSMWID